MRLQLRQLLDMVLAFTWRNLLSYILESPQYVQILPARLTTTSLKLCTLKVCTMMLIELTV